MLNDKLLTILTTIPGTPGIYQFLNSDGNFLYVGKAKNLKKRLTSYSKSNALSPRIARMVFLAEKIEIVQTENEVEALLLEHNLIKKHAPKYNILLRDDKTFPYIHITNHQFPRIEKFRGARTSGHYFGPFASAHDVNHTIDILRKSFLLRNCSDLDFKTRKKPCLEYQIKRCTAPCVSYVSEDEYKLSVKNAVDFLDGKSVEVQKKLTQKMQKFSEDFEYEKAAAIRDQLKSLHSIQTKQNINIFELANCDIITLVEKNNMICIYVSFYRGGHNYGAKPYFFEGEFPERGQTPFSRKGSDPFLETNHFLSEFLGQFYLSQMPPNLVLLNLDLPENNLMNEFLSKIAGKKVIVKTPKGGAKLSTVKDQERIALQNIEQKISQNLSDKKILLEIKRLFDLPNIPQKIEVYDNSHTGNTNAVGAMITAGSEGFIKSGYRKFNIGKHDKKTAKDDTAMMREVLFRRYSKIKKDSYPDLIILDGGKPQLSAAQKIFTELKIDVPFIAMAKGEERNKGEEKFFQVGKEMLELPKSSPVLHYLQRLRDEAHRFAIMSHRVRRSKAFTGH